MARDQATTVLFIELVPHLLIVVAHTSIIRRFPSFFVTYLTMSTVSKVMLTLAPYHILLYGSLLGMELYQVWNIPTVAPITSPKTVHVYWN